MRIRLFPPYYSCRYSTSPVADWLDDFAQSLKASGYTRTPIRGHISILRWALERRAPIPRDTHFSHAELQQLFGSSKKPRLFRATQHVFERFLRSCEQWIEEPRTDRHAALLDAYRAYLLEMRGLSAMSVYHHIAAARAFLKQAVPSTRCLAEVSVKDTERFVAVSAQRFGRSSLQQRIGYLRSFLRFCHDRGVVRAHLDAIDAPRKYRGERPPRAIPWKLAQRLLASIDRSSSLGERDYAVLYLMAHYGLRTGEITTLRLDSIDWNAGELHVAQNKTRSALVLPITVQARAVLKRYLRRGRPHTERGELFLTVLAPVGPLMTAAIGTMFRRRAQQSGLPLNSSSPYGLRHGFAMRLLEKGVGVKAIGDLLGHCSLESTCVYLRLHVEALRDVALPMPALPTNSGRVS
jgi:site-specific recombinase XerD